MPKGCPSPETVERLVCGDNSDGESREQGEKGDEVVAELAPGKEAHHAEDDGEGERLIDCHDARAIAGTVGIAERQA